MLTVTDIFAGAGGSSTGIAAVPGVQVAIAANHWQLAVDVHQDNHQQTEHACVDLHMEDPRNFPRTEVLWASPECTKWSIANSKAKELSREMGGDPTLFDDVPVELESEGEDEITRSRLLMFDVLRFVEHHRYRYVVVENVVDVATQPKYSQAWQAWRRGLDKLGYAYRVLSLNSMHAQLAGQPAPQSRDRLYVVAWPAAEKAPDFDALAPTAWCGRCEQMVTTRQAWKNGRTVGRYRAQYLYSCTLCWKPAEPMWLPASVAIDWDLPAERIGDRTKPLSPKTMARIREGLRRYGHRFVVEAAGNTYDSASGARGNYLRAWPDSEPLRTLHTTASKGIVLDAIRSAPILSSTDEPMRTQTTAYTRSLVIPLRGTNTPKPVGLPLDTIAASGNHHGLLVPVEGRDGKEARSTGEPGRTQTTRNETGLLVPYYSASEAAKPTEYPVGTLTCVDRYALVMRNNTPRGNAGQMVTPVWEPLRTLTANSPQSLLEGDRFDRYEPTDEDVAACRFRMLEPSEIALGMAFPADYRWQGTKRERVRLAGNAVTPPSSRDLLTVLAESLGVAA